MTKKLIKLSIAIVVIAGVVGSSFSTEARPEFFAAAKKFGAKNCQFCHEKPRGGKGWNDRGQWLIAEKQRRKAKTVDVEWLADYGEGAKKDAEDTKSKENKDESNKKKKDAENTKSKENKDESNKKEKPNQ